MKLILRFLKPHRKLCALTIFLLIVDVAGALFIPTLVAEMLNQGTSGSSFAAIVQLGVTMAVISVLAGACAIGGGYACAALSAALVLRGTVTSGVLGQVLGLALLVGANILAASMENSGIWGSLDWPALVLAVLLSVLMCIATVLRGPLYEDREGEDIDEFSE